MEQQNCSTGDEIDQEPLLNQSKGHEVVELHPPNDKGKKSLPCPFLLSQNYPPEVECTFSMQTMLPRQLNQDCRFLTTVARAIFSIKCYPTGNEYMNIAKQIVSKYPFLASSAGTPYVSIFFTGKQ